MSFDLSIKMTNACASFSSKIYKLRQKKIIPLSNEIGCGWTSRRRLYKKRMATRGKEEKINMKTMK